MQLNITVNLLRYYKFKWYNHCFINLNFVDLRNNDYKWPTHADSISLDSLLFEKLSE